MTDKSFGDHTIRNTLKNPLLSSAVTGLSLEDLTQNAVLLPVSLSQEVITRAEPATQSVTLRHPDNVITNYPSGDANANPLPLNLSTTPSATSINILPISKPECETDNLKQTLSKVSAKTDDDFDVNEYFARLQGSRYVSAPLNSAHKEDSNANLEATEENLEEINLNEPEKVEQSITADIAQNFSQLPTVLPQMASAVFSSFSNMLQTRKSREPTPEARSSGYQDVQFDRPKDAISEILPPKEPPTLPPTFGTTNYRLSTKKKYAQIPGLTSGDNAQFSFQSNQISQPINRNSPQYFVPNVDNNKNESSSSLNQNLGQPTEVNKYVFSAHATLATKAVDNVGASYFDTHGAPPILKTTSMSQGQPAKKDIIEIVDHNRPAGQNVSPYCVPPFSNTELKSEIVTEHNVDSLRNESNEVVNMLNVLQNVPIGLVASADHKEEASKNILQYVPELSPSLPPPPMFANAPNVKNEVQKSVSRSVLPPSIARRIGANQPIIKQTHAPAFTENFLVPTAIDIQTLSDTLGIVQPSTDITSNSGLASVYPLPPQAFSNTSSTMSSYFVSTSQPSLSIVSDLESIQATPQLPSGTTIAPPPVFSPFVSPHVTQSTFEQDSSFVEKAASHRPPSISTNTVTLIQEPNKQQITGPPNIPLPSSTFSSKEQPNTKSSYPPSFATNLPPTTLTPGVPTAKESLLTSTNISFPMPKKDISSQPPAALFTPGSLSTAQQNIPPSFPLGNPPTAPTVPAMSMFIPSNEAQSSILSVSQTLSESAPPRVSEPPKAVVSTNFRMTKKRPQYYAGPIEGVGAISNNVKPIIAPVDTGVFQGALFTPTIDNTQQATALETKPFDISRPVPSAELNVYPFNVNVSSTYPTHEATQYSDYNTAFDMSRKTTESFNQAKEDSSGFGLFGSLKSKLSSIDINKIQSTVTTFFDPTYNDSKKDVMGVQEIAPYHHHQQYANLDQSQGNNFNIFVPQAGQVPQVEQGTEAYAQYYNYQTPYQYSYSQQSQPYQNQETHTSFQNTGQNMESYYSNPSILTYQSSTFVNQQLVFNVNPVAISDSTTGKHDLDDIHSHELKPELPTHAINTEPAYSTIHSQETNLKQPIQSVNENLPSKQKLDKKDDEQTGNTKEENVSILQSAPANFFYSPREDTNVPSISSTKVNEAFTHNIGSGTIITSLLFDNQEVTNPDLEFSSSKMSCPPNVTSEGGITANFKENQAESKNDGCISTFKEVTTKDIKENVTLMDSQSRFPDIKSLTQDIDSETSNYKLFTNSPADFFGLFNKDLNNTSIFSDFILSDDRSFAIPQSKTVEKDDEYIIDAPQLDASSAPLFGLSSMLADKTKELSDLQDEMRKMSIEQPNEVDTIFNRGTNISFFENLEVIGTEKNTEIAKDEVPDLNICETCREVSKLDDREKDDLTTQLIENITSPIQLSNPVEVPLTESNTPVDERDDFSSEQCAEISHITEETIEAIQVKSATELLDDPIINVRKYGWSDEPYSKNIDVGYSSFQSNKDNDYSLNINPNTVGFFGGTSLYENMDSNKDLQKNFFGQDDVPKILPRQMSVPSAPPEEDDSKSESIDVHSIEQDAKKDFPIFEEFVIEPDDFKKSTDSIHQLDSFTSRVDKFKKKEEGVTDKIEKTSPILKSATSPSLPMASYFDTGNYAVETHYKNSLSSPNEIRAPQGFEDRYQMLSSNTDVDKNDIPFIPETSTQTRPIYSPTFTTAQTNSTIVTSSKLASATLKLSDVNTVKNISGLLEETHKVDQALTSIQSFTEETTPNFDLLQAQIKRVPTLSTSSEKIPNFDSIFGQKTDDKNAMNIQKPVAAASVELKPLPDPINFFSTNLETVEKTNTDDQGFNRLASYFSSPAKTDHTKSFFELSQSQNHYRQDANVSSHSSNVTNRTSVSVAQGSDNRQATNIHNIPQEQYLANLSIMRDLTSCQNADFKPEQIVRTVNYFTIEYDNEALINNLNKGEPDLKTTVDNTDFKEFKIDETKMFIDDKAFIKIIQKCPHCCNFNKDLVKDLDNISNDFNKFDVKTCMDSKSDSKKDSNNVGAMEGGGNQFESRQSVTVNFDGHNIQEDSNESVAVTDENRSSTEYSPVKHHWFYRVDVEGKSLWRGFSTVDSKALEDAFHSPNLNENTVVATDGGRYDVNVNGRLRFPVYWNDKPSNVLRCSWFYKGTTEARYVPYPEAVAEKLEEEYGHGMRSGEWHRRLVLPNNELVVLHGPAVMVHFLQGGASDAFSTPPLFAFGKRVYRNPPKIRVARDQPAKIDHLVMMVHGAGEYRHQQEKIQSTMRPVRRGCDESEIEEVEPSSIDHLLLLCHGVGSACDMKFRAVEEVVDDFRATSLQLIQSHYRQSYESGAVGRVEVLPISWHSTLHSGETGVDRRLARITLDSIPRLRNFTNDTVLDVLFYTSPVFCQTIINTVCAEINRIYKLFRDRNPSFSGGVSLGGHSLGSVILYDLLCHQNVSGSEVSYEKRYVSGAAGTGQPSVKYPQLSFSPVALYALGSPIAIFECIRGVDCLGPDFALPTCKNFFNIFHPYDPIAYRIEPLIDPQLRDVKPYLIPHHKGRKRMHLELKDTMARVGADIKQKLMESIRNTWSSMWKTQQPPTDQQLEKVVEEELEKEHLTSDNKEESIGIEEATPKMLGKLNDGRRVDFVLQETPLEMINEYIFAMRSHVCYWESEDTMLLMLREIYSALGVAPDCSVPQRNLTVQRTKIVNLDESIPVISEDYPSTSRGAT